MCIHAKYIPFMHPHYIYIARERERDPHTHMHTIHIFIHTEINLYTLYIQTQDKSIWQPSKFFISHPKSVIFK